MHRRVPAALAALAWLLLLPTSSAARWYITERFEVTLRSGPGTDYKILEMVASGAPMEKLEEREGWARVRTGGGGEGWVVGRYLTEDPPKGPLLATATRELDSLRARAAELETALAAASKDGQAATREARALRQKLEALEREYADWRRVNQGVVELRQQAEQLAQEGSAARTELERLSAENRSLQAREKFYWFFSGVIVLLLGWALGYLYATSRQRAKAQSRFKF